MQLQPVSDAQIVGALVEVVKEVPDDLVGDQQPQKRWRARSRQRRKERGAVYVTALLRDGVQSVLTDRRIRDRAGERLPVVNLLCDGGQTPSELAECGMGQASDLPC